MRKKTSIAAAGLLSLAGILAAGTSNASPIVFQTASSATNSTGQPVSASATFSLSANTLVIQLTDTLANPTDVAQLISGLSFTLSNGLTSGTLSGSAANFLNVNADGSFTNAGNGLTGWVLQPGFDLCDICSSGGGSSVPAGLIIGPPDSNGVYSNANGSIAGNSPHNPFINQTGAYTLDIQGLTANDSISSVVFGFGTTYGQDTTNGVCTAGCGSTVPEPGALALFAAGLGGLGIALSRKRRRARAELI